MAWPPLFVTAKSLNFIRGQRHEKLHLGTHFRSILRCGCVYSVQNCTKFSKSGRQSSFSE
jgi:hypothetical protein